MVATVGNSGNRKTMVGMRVSGTGKTTPQLWCSRTPRNVGFHLLWITFCPWTKGGIPPGTSTSCSPELVTAQFWRDFLGGADFRDIFFGNLEDLMYQNCWYTMVYHGIRWYNTTENGLIQQWFNPLISLHKNRAFTPNGFLSISGLFSEISSLEIIPSFGSIWRFGSDTSTDCSLKVCWMHWYVGKRQPLENGQTMFVPSFKLHSFHHAYSKRPWGPFEVLLPQILGQLIVEIHVIQFLAAVSDPFAKLFVQLPDTTGTES